MKLSLILCFGLILSAVVHAEVAPPTDYAKVRQQIEECSTLKVAGNPTYSPLLIWQVKFALADGSGLELPKAPAGVDPSNLIEAINKLMPEVAHNVADCLDAGYPLRQIISQSNSRGVAHNVPLPFLKSFHEYREMVILRAKEREENLNANYVAVVTETEFMQKIQDGKIRSIHDTEAGVTVNKALSDIVVPTIRDRLLVEIMLMNYNPYRHTHWRELF